MIIWGSRVRYKDIGQGEFYCPRCRDKRPYKHKQAARYFTLYFIPLFATQQLGEVVECQVCKTAFETSVLQLRGGPPRETKKNDVASLMNAIPDRLRGGDPLEYIVRDLTGAGLDLNIARGAVNGAAGSPIRKCSACSLSYVSTISQCKACGRSLV